MEDEPVVEGLLDPLVGFVLPSLLTRRKADEVGNSAGGFLLEELGDDYTFGGDKDGPGWGVWCGDLDVGLCPAQSWPYAHPYEQGKQAVFHRDGPLQRVRSSTGFLCSYAMDAPIHTTPPITTQ